MRVLVCWLVLLTAVWRLPTCCGGDPVLAVRGDAEIAESLRQLRAHVHLDAQGKIQSIELSGAKLTDVDLAQLRGLTAVESLEIAGGQITDAGLANLKGLTTLVRLYLHDLDVTDAGLKHLGGLTDLESLSLQNTKTTGKGLAWLKGLTNLQVLNLGQNRHFGRRPVTSERYG